MLTHQEEQRRFRYFHDAGTRSMEDANLPRNGVPQELLEAVVVTQNDGCVKQARAAGYVNLHVSSDEHSQTDGGSDRDSAWSSDSESENHFQVPVEPPVSNTVTVTTTANIMDVEVAEPDAAQSLCQRGTLGQQSRTASASPSRRSRRPVARQGSQCHTVSGSSILRLDQPVSQTHGAPGPPGQRSSCSPKRSRAGSLADTETLSQAETLTQVGQTEYAMIARPPRGTSKKRRAAAAGNTQSTSPPKKPRFNKA
eukprot:TRINITY_DN448_c0_g1_i8.p1 TRINITY_DN448_c0_g1~~TRINITY_DN448_c0_g1_i8.p1  ORF type:complete len:254 (+),score=3.73 TRINITY_DN448_c0_g1_i8:119-880(+)